MTGRTSTCACHPALAHRRHASLASRVHPSAGRQKRNTCHRCAYQPSSNPLCQLLVDSIVSQRYPKSVPQIVGSDHSTGPRTAYTTPAISTRSPGSTVIGASFGNAACPVVSTKPGNPVGHGRNYRRGSRRRPRRGMHPHRYSSAHLPITGVSPDLCGTHRAVTLYLLRQNDSATVHPVNAPRIARRCGP